MHKTGGPQLKLSAACFVVRSCLADVSRVLSMKRTIQPSRPKKVLVLISLPRKISVTLVIPTHVNRFPGGWWSASKLVNAMRIMKMMGSSVNSASMGMELSPGNLWYICKSPFQTFRWVSAPSVENLLRYCSAKFLRNQKNPIWVKR